MRVLTNRVEHVYYIVDMVVESLVNVDVTVGVLEETRVVQTSVRRRAMLVSQVQIENASSYDTVVSINVDSFVPSFNSMVAYPVSVKIYVHGVYREVVNALRVEVKVDPTMEINVPIDIHDHLSANDVVRNELVETKTYVLVSFDLTKVVDYEQPHLVEIKEEVN